MTDLARRFTNRTGAYPDEPARALVHRRGHVAGMGTVKRAWRFVGTTPDDVRAGRGIERVAAACGVDAKTLGNATPHKVGDDVAFLGHRFHPESLRRQHRRWCPACLAKVPYHRAAWDLDAVNACVEHRLRLASTCPSCDRPVDWGHLDPARCKCGARLATTVCESVDDTAMAFERWLEDRLLTPDGAGAAGLLDSMPLRPALALLERVGAHALAPDVGFADAWRNHGAARALAEGFSHLARGEEAFRAFLSGLTAAAPARAASAEARGRAGSRWGLYLAYGEFAVWLTSVAKNSAYREVVRIARDHAEAHVVLKRNAAVFGAADRARTLNLQEAAVLCGIGHVRLARILRAKGSMPAETQRGRPVLLDPEVVEGIRVRLADSVDLGGAAPVLDVTKAVVSSLVEAGHLDAFVEGSSGRLGIYAIERTSVADLLARLERRAGPERPGAGLHGLPKAAANNYASVADAVGWILAGTLQVRGVDPDATGLNRYLLAGGDVIRARRAAAGRGLSFNDAATELGVKWDVVADLHRIGVLAATERNDGWEVAREDLGGFVAEYVKGSDVARALGLHWTWAPRELAKKGILPAIGRDRCRSTFYRRADFTCDARL